MKWIRRVLIVYLVKILVFYNMHLALLNPMMKHQILFFVDLQVDVNNYYMCIPVLPILFLFLLLEM